MLTNSYAHVESPPNGVHEEIDKLGPWFHNLHLPGGAQTAPHGPFGDYPAYKWRTLALYLPEDLRGWTALDIGCNAGYYSFELARRGAQVTGIDVNQHYLRQAEWAVELYGLRDRVRFRQMQVYDLAHSEERYDLVLFMGVFYHLRYPMLGLDIITQKVKKLLVFQTLTIPGKEIRKNTYDLDIDRRAALRAVGWPKMAFIEHMLADDPTNWWVPNHAGVKAMLRSSGMKDPRCIGEEIYLAEPDPEHPSSVSTWNVAELLSATGRPWRTSEVRIQKSENGRRTADGGL